jgi:hypothetical protein
MPLCNNNHNNYGARPIDRPMHPKREASGESERNEQRRVLSPKTSHSRNNGLMEKRERKSKNEPHFSNPHHSSRLSERTINDSELCGSKEEEDDDDDQDDHVPLQSAGKSYLAPRRSRRYTVVAVVPPSPVDHCRHDPSKCIMRAEQYFYAHPRPLSFEIVLFFGCSPRYRPRSVAATKRLSRRPGGVDLSRSQKWRSGRTLGERRIWCCRCSSERGDPSPTRGETCCRCLYDSSVGQVRSTTTKNSNDYTNTA